jgi:hypothetical protein
LSVSELFFKYVLIHIVTLLAAGRLTPAAKSPK